MRWPRSRFADLTRFSHGLLYEDVKFSQLQRRTGPSFIAHDGRRTASGASIDILPDPTFGRIFGNYRFDMGSNVGVGVTGVSGKPLTALAAHPNYQNDSEIPTTVRGAGFETVDGFKRRTPAHWDVGLQAAYSLNLPSQMRVTLLADAFNLFNLRRPLDYNAAVEQSFGSPNPDFGTVTNQNVAGQMYQAPFQMRIGARLHF
jgi:hypothetical protein